MKSMRAKDIMCRRVVTVTPDTTILDAVRLFERRGISGAPVVGPRRRLLGVVSQKDLLRRHREQETGEVPAFYREGDRVAFTTVTEAPGRARVAEVMTPAALCAREDAPVEQLARFMLARRVHRVVIVERGAVRGIVTTTDMLKVIAGKGFGGIHESHAASSAASSRRGAGRAGRRAGRRSGSRVRGRRRARQEGRGREQRRQGVPR
jgi:CBS domain-containing protein